MQWTNYFNMDISENDIEWTTGTDKSYGQTVFEWWQNELGKNPTDKDLRRLRNAKSAFLSRLEDFKAEHKQMQKDPNSGEPAAVDMMELIELYEDAAEHLTKLYNSFRKDGAPANKAKKPSVQQVISTIAKRRAAKDSADYSKEMIELYLTVHHEIKSSVSEEREEALKRCKSQSVEQELIKISDGNLYNLRKDLKKSLEQYSQVFSEK